MFSSIHPSIHIIAIVSVVFFISSNRMWMHVKEDGLSWWFCISIHAPFSHPSETVYNCAIFVFGKILILSLLIFFSLLIAPHLFLARSLRRSRSRSHFSFRPLFNYTIALWNAAEKNAKEDHFLISPHCAFARVSIFSVHDWNYYVCTIYLCIVHCILLSFNRQTRCSIPNSRNSMRTKWRILNIISRLAAESCAEMR